MEGIDLQNMQAKWGDQQRERVEWGLQKFKSAGWIHLEGHHAMLTDEGMLRADGIASELFL